MARRAHDVYTEWRGGTCRVKWWTGEYHPNGRKRFESQGGFTDEEKAYLHGQDQMRDIRHKVHVSNRDGSTPLSDWLDQWLDSLELAHLSMKTYRWSVGHIRTYFAGKSVGEIDIMNFRAFKKYLSAKKPNGAGLGPTSVKGIVNVFSLIMDDAVKMNLRAASPVEKESRRGRYEKKPRERKKDMSVEGVAQLAENAQSRWGDAGYAFFWTMAMTGMRPGELFGLTRDYCYPAWPASDPRVDADSAAERAEDGARYGRGPGLMPAIRVQRQVQYEESQLGFYPPKYASARTLVIPPFLADVIAALLESHDSQWVFPGIGGGCLGQVAFDRIYWRPVADGAAANLSSWAKKPHRELQPVADWRGKRMYLIRHGHKAWLDEDGHNRYAVEARMGHEMQGVEGTYSSLTVPMEQAFMEKLQLRWAGLGRPEWRPGREEVPAEAVSVQSLIRDAVGRGLSREECFEAVRQVKPGVGDRTLKGGFNKERRRLVSRSFPSDVHSIPN